MIKFYINKKYLKNILMKIEMRVSIAVEKNGKFLVLKRSDEDTMPGLWEFPGGKIAKGESLSESAKREAFEETDLRLRSSKYCGYSERFSEDTTTRSGFHVIVHSFYSNKFKGKIKLSKEHTAFRWMTKNEIMKMMTSKEIGIDTKAFFRLKNKV